MSQCARCNYRGNLNDHAEETEHPLCFVCGRQSLTDFERQTCAKCIARTRANLADIESMSARFDGYLVESRFPANSGAEIRGGSGDDEQPIADALVMLAGGGTGSPNGRRVTSNEKQRHEVAYPEFGEHPAYTRGADRVIFGREHVADELDHDPQSVSGLLAIHENDWRHLLRHPAAGPESVSGSVAYLMSQLDRMAQAYSEFDTFAQDIHNLRARIRTAIGLSERPVVGADCFDCGERLVRRYRYKGDQLKPEYDPRNGPGLEDHWTCPRCDRVYTQAEYMLAVRSHHADKAADEWRPTTVAAYLVDRPVRTVQMWMHDLIVTAACRITDRRTVVWMPDVTEHARRQPKRNRREAS